jgi:hypothetical protein
MTSWCPRPGRLSGGEGERRPDRDLPWITLIVALIE